MAATDSQAGWLSGRLLPCDDTQLHPMHLPCFLTSKGILQPLDFVYFGGHTLARMCWISHGHVPLHCPAPICMSPAALAPPTRDEACCRGRSAYLMAEASRCQAMSMETLWAPRCCTKCNPTWSAMRRRSLALCWSAWRSVLACMLHGGTPSVHDMLGCCAVTT